MSDGSTVLCKICCKPIEPAAKKCTECDCYQNHWLRHLSLSTSVLALLVALVSVLGFVIPIIVSSLERDRIAVVGSLLSYETRATRADTSEGGATDNSSRELQLSFVLFNDGNVPLVVSPNLSYASAMEDLSYIGFGQLRHAADHADRLILAPDESRVFVFFCENTPNISISELRGSRAVVDEEKFLTPSLNEITFRFALESRLGRRELSLKYGCDIVPDVPVPYVGNDP